MAAKLVFCQMGCLTFFRWTSVWPIGLGHQHHGLFCRRYCHFERTEESCSNVNANKYKYAVSYASILPKWRWSLWSEVTMYKPYLLAEGWHPAAGSALLANTNSALSKLQKSVGKGFKSTPCGLITDRHLLKSPSESSIHSRNELMTLRFLVFGLCSVQSPPRPSAVSLWNCWSPDEIGHYIINKWLFPGQRRWWQDIFRLICICVSGCDFHWEVFWLGRLKPF